MNLDDIVEKVHPMKHVFWATIIQISVLAFMGITMIIIGVAFS